MAKLSGLLGPSKRVATGFRIALGSRQWPRFVDPGLKTGKASRDTSDELAVHVDFLGLTAYECAAEKYSMRGLIL